MNDDKIVIDLPDKLKMVERQAKYNIIMSCIWGYIKSLILLILVVIIFNYLVNGIDLRLALIIAIVSFSIMSVFNFISCLKCLDDELRKMSSNISEQLILDTKNKYLELRFSSHKAYGDSRLKLNNLKAIKYFKKDKALYVKADYGDFVVENIDYPFKSKYNLLDSGIVLENLTIPVEKLGNSMINNGVEINVEEHISSELDELRVDVKKVCEIIDTGKCIYKDLFKGKCKSCSLSENCNSQESNTDNQCSYWRCKFRESTDRCLVADVTKKIV